MQNAGTLETDYLENNGVLSQALGVGLFVGNMLNTGTATIGESATASSYIDNRGNMTIQSGGVLSWRARAGPNCATSNTDPRRRHYQQHLARYGDQRGERTNDRQGHHSQQLLQLRHAHPVRHAGCSGRKFIVQLWHDSHRHHPRFLDQSVHQSRDHQPGGREHPRPWRRMRPWSVQQFLRRADPRTRDHYRRLCLDHKRRRRDLCRQRLDHNRQSRRGER